MDTLDRRFLQGNRKVGRTPRGATDRPLPRFGRRDPSSESLLARGLPTRPSYTAASVPAASPSLVVRIGSLFGLGYAGIYIWYWGVNFTKVWKIVSDPFGLTLEDAGLLLTFFVIWHYGGKHLCGAVRRYLQLMHISISLLLERITWLEEHLPDAHPAAHHSP